MKIDHQKLKAAIKSAEQKYNSVWTRDQRSALKCGYVKFTRTNGTTWVFSASECQILYAIAAQARGVLSMKKMWIPRCDSTGSEDLIEFTKEMQTEMIGDAGKQFERPTPSVLPAAETVALA